MNRVMCIVSYDGTSFQGYQVQPNERTVQGEIQKTLSKIHKGEEVKVTGSGRTDAKVHAVGQVIHFDTPLSLHEEAWKKALNANLPSDIRIVSSQKISENFHARFDVERKEYRYKIDISKDQSVFMRNYAYHYPFELNESSIRNAMSYLLGTHDFTSFCSAKTEVEDKVRTIYELELLEEDSFLTVRIVGNGFLYNMVRIIVGTLLEIGQGKKDSTEIFTILEKKDRSSAGKTAPAHGLYLWKVNYKDVEKC
ncbi:tRNA pseudouridine(38-40) synthase TruA [Bacillus alkalisoli]|uniref:tRNA pseudouridine(38-40) synthase TruA n=1 Tax=Bacillus alkalisoli TaxID=2011008 RepID=UPI000C24EC9B|nr:tRNA pseudouridine(38-40) synthase TruA [Bacillus alkalisoli]